MPLVAPFSGQVVDPSWAARVVSPLHDVLSVEDRRDIMATNPDSYLYVTSDPLDLPGPPRGDPSQANAVAQQRLLALGAYRPQVGGACFVYRMVEDGIEHSGVVAQVAVAGFADGRVLGHESVQPDRVDGLVRHFDAVPRRSELVSLVHRDDRAVAELVETACRTAPVLEVTDVSGVLQSVWPADRPTSVELVAALGALPLYIADGHHRVAASVRRWERDGRPADASVLCATYAEQQIRLHSFHRRVRGPLDPQALVAALSRDFDVRPVAAATRERRLLGLYLGGRWLQLAPRTDPHAPGVAGLDVTMLDEQVLRPLLGVEKDDPRLEFVPELRDLAVATQDCDADGGALFTVDAPTMDDLVSVAERGEVMGAKSTYVQPKPRTGIFLL
jgi:uncharacterized protein (DUF1015 family)